jgi:hypothetical protein
VLADVPDRLPRGHAVEYRDAGQRGAGPSPAAEARDLDPLVDGAF